MKARYVHTSLVAEDWRVLSRFYTAVFGCIPVPPERDLSGDWLDAATGVTGAHIRGIHLRLPGYGSDGPTLEVFQYDETVEAPLSVPNRLGLAHLAFSVEDVNAVCSRVRESGGAPLGEVVTRSIPGAGMLTFCYCTDPEGNVLELQHWSGEDASSG